MPGELILWLCDECIRDYEHKGYTVERRQFPRYAACNECGKPIGEEEEKGA